MESISQWQRYGADGFGYCLGIDAKKLLGLDDFTNVWLRRLVYVPDQQNALVERVLTSFRRYLWPYVSYLSKEDVQLATNTRTGMPDVRDHLVLDLSSLALVLKNPHFQDESEWRLIFLAPRSHWSIRNMIGFTERSNILKPHIDIAVRNLERGDRLPITEIVCGPRLDQALARLSVEQLLEVNEHTVTMIHPSQLSGVWP